MRFQIDNEYGKLEAVLVHRPGDEIDRLTHDNRAQFLFEDIPYLRRMQDEHDAFVAVMRDRGVDAVYLEDLLADIVRETAAREHLIDAVCRTGGVPAIAEELAGCGHWSAEELVQVLFAGVTAEEFRARSGRRIASNGPREHFLLKPIPNAYFARDPAVVVGEAAISSKMHYRERIRESVLVREVLEHHPDYRDNTIAFGGTGDPAEDRPYTIEGGDVVVLSAKAVLVGASERTRSETIELLAGKCFAAGRVRRVYEIPIPAERSFMHLDTVFTVVDRGVVVWYSEVMENVRAIHRYEPANDAGAVAATRLPESRSFAEILTDEFETEVTIIDTAGGRQHFAAREQRSDGTNTLAIAPGVAITYERNERTTAALEEHGVTCLGIGDSELMRGLGGPRCMTMPLRRS